MASASSSGAAVAASSGASSNSGAGFSRGAYRPAGSYNLLKSMQAGVSFPAASQPHRIDNSFVDRTTPDGALYLRTPKPVFEHKGRYDPVRDFDRPPPQRKPEDPDEARRRIREKREARQRQVLALVARDALKKGENSATPSPRRKRKYDYMLAM